MSHIADTFPNPIVCSQVMLSIDTETNLWCHVYATVTVGITSGRRSIAWKSQSYLTKDFPGPHLELSHVGDAKEEEDAGIEEGGVEDAGRSQGEKPLGPRWEWAGGAENIFLLNVYKFYDTYRVK